MDDLNSEHSWHLVCLAWFYALVLPLTICHKQVTIRSRAGKSLGWKRGGGGKKAGVLLTPAVDEGLCKTRAHSPRSSSRQFSLHSTRLSNTSCHKSLPALLSQPVTKLRLSRLTLVWSYSVGHCPRTVCTAPVGGVSAAVRPAGPPCRVRAATQGPRPPLQTRDRGYFTTSTSFFSSQQTPVFWMS